MCKVNAKYVNNIECSVRAFMYEACKKIGIFEVPTEGRRISSSGNALLIATFFSFLIKQIIQKKLQFTEELYMYFIDCI